DAEVLRVDRAALPAGQRDWRLCRGADARVSVARVEDVRAVARRVHPARDDRARARHPAGAERDVLADLEGHCAIEVSRGAHALERRVAMRTDMLEVVAE